MQHEYHARTHEKTNGRARFSNKEGTIPRAFLSSSDALVLLVDLPNNAFIRPLSRELQVRNIHESTRFSRIVRHQSKAAILLVSI